MSVNEETEVEITSELITRASQEVPSQVMQLNLHNYKIGRIQGLEKATKLRQLDLTFNNIQRIEGLETCVQLREIKMYNNQIEVLQGLKKQTNLQTLHLGNNRIFTIQGLDRELPRQVKSLTLSGNKITAMEGLAKAAALTSLDLSNNQIPKINGLNALINLEELHLNGNQLSAIEGLTFCHRLKELSLCDNQIKSLKGLMKLAELDILRLDGNQLTSLEGLPKLPLLTELYVARNHLTALEPLGKACPQLEILDAGENKVASVKRVGANLSALVELTELRLEGNPVVQANSGVYRNRICTALPRIQFLDNGAATAEDRRPVSVDPSPSISTHSTMPPDSSRPSSSGTTTAASVSGVGGAPASEFDPSQAEMEAYMQKMGIFLTANPHMGRPSSSRGKPSNSLPPPASPSTLSQEDRPTSSSSNSQTLVIEPPRPVSRGGSGGVKKGGPSFTPMMYQRPPSSGTRTARGKKMLTPDEFENIASDFTQAMDHYQQGLTQVLATVKRHLKEDPEQVLAELRAQGKSASSLLAQKMPDLPEMRRIPAEAACPSYTAFPPDSEGASANDGKPSSRRNSSSKADADLSTPAAAAAGASSQKDHTSSSGKSLRSEPTRRPLEITLDADKEFPAERAASQKSSSGERSSPKGVKVKTPLAAVTNIDKPRGEPEGGDKSGGGLESSPAQKAKSNRLKIGGVSIDRGATNEALDMFERLFPSTADGGDDDDDRTSVASGVSGASYPLSEPARGFLASTREEKEAELESRTKVLDNFVMVPRPPSVGQPNPMLRRREPNKTRASWDSHPVQRVTSKNSKNLIPEHGEDCYLSSDGESEDVEGVGGARSPSRGSSRGSHNRSGLGSPKGKDPGSPKRLALGNPGAYTRFRPRSAGKGRNGAAKGVTVVGMKGNTEQLARAQTGLLQQRPITPRDFAK